MKLVIVVVFDDREAFAGRQLQKREPTSHRQRHRGRILMMRRDVHGSDRPPRDHLSERLYVDTVFIDSHRDDLGTRDPEGLPRGPISGMLDRDRITRTSQRPRDKRERHLAAARDED